MLLFVVETKQDDGREFFNDARLFKYSVHETINLLPIFKRLAQSRPRNEPALGPAVHFTGSVVVRVEQEGVLRVNRRVVRQSFFKNKGLEKPTRVREMPSRSALSGSSSIVFSLQPTQQDSILLKKAPRFPIVSIILLSLVL